MRSHSVSIGRPPRAAASPAWYSSWRSRLSSRGAVLRAAGGRGRGVGRDGVRCGAPRGRTRDEAVRGSAVPGDHRRGRGRRGGRIGGPAAAGGGAWSRVSAARGYRDRAIPVRAGELARLASWCEGTGMRVRLLTGAGGQGKTRLARELTARLAATGEWAAEIIHEGARLPAGIRLPCSRSWTMRKPGRTRFVTSSSRRWRSQGTRRCGCCCSPAARVTGGTGCGRRRRSLRWRWPGRTMDPLAPLEGTQAGRAQAFSEAVADYAEALRAMNWPCAEPEARVA